MIDRFLITGMGACGTMFLANLMNCSKKWTVAHEPNGKEPQTVAGYDASRFQRKWYGEVNGRLRCIAGELGLPLLGVLLRDPSRQFLSMYNKSLVLKARRHPHPGRWAAEGRTLSGYVALDHWIQEGATVIFFEKMTTDPAYMQRVLDRFGITDVRVTPAMIAQPINVNRQVQARQLGELPAVHLQRYHAEARWFKEKYYEAESPPIPNQV